MITIHMLKTLTVVKSDCPAQASKENGIHEISISGIASFALITAGHQEPMNSMMFAITHTRWSATNVRMSQGSVKVHEVMDSSDAHIGTSCTVQFVQQMLNCRQIQ